jgi:hypothetical protein
MIGAPRNLPRAKTCANKQTPIGIWNRTSIWIHASHSISHSLTQNNVSKFDQGNSCFATEMLLVHHRRFSGLHTNAKTSNGKSVLGSVSTVPRRYIRHGSNAIDWAASVSPCEVAVVVRSPIYMWSADLHWRFWGNKAFPKPTVPCSSLVSGRVGIKLADAWLSIASTFIGTKFLALLPFLAVSPDAEHQVAHEAQQQDNHFKFYY